MIYTAMPVTNAVPKVVAAKPGIVTLADLPPITGPTGGSVTLGAVSSVSRAMSTQTADRARADVHPEHRPHVGHGRWLARGAAGR